MEIKIQQHTCQIENGGNATHLYEGGGVKYEYISYKDKTHFNLMVKSRTDTENRLYIGIPYNWLKEDDPIKIEDGYFLLLQFQDTLNAYWYLIIKDCTIFITNNGQTIDKVVC